MVSAAQIRNGVGIVGNVISFFLFASPVPTFWRIVKNKSVEEFQVYPYIATVMNCMLWVFYGLPVVHTDSILVTTINGVGLVVEAIYLSIFFIYSKQQKNTRRNIILLLLLEIAAVVAVVLITLFALHTTFAKQTFVGVLCDAFNIAMYGSPCLVIGKVIKTRSVEYMPFWLSFVSFINAAIWTSYSLIHKLDLYVLISNGMGTLLCASQLIVYFVYRGSTPKVKDAEKPAVVEFSPSAVAAAEDRV
ncbi:PREDICTED: bidirectional sugar transporter SWEET8 [Tarenaya hassleriana]|uniref:bidirectional sugar transporter SWEET8 n=1 Tax=Tarenaya hassleriana TaxID=28532 RepID=UPI00053CA9A5|nr:PREDICTED: bidirectional sugar transporter SWEET8 [Tarenaya hassleriana]